jgi:transcriptional regulator with XRE-family HTH domain
MSNEIANGRNAVYAEEAFVVDVQILLHEIMEEKGITRAELARLMGVSRARITQIFSDDCKNFTIRLLARAMHSLGEEPKISCDYIDKQQVENNIQRWNTEFDVPATHFLVEMKEERSAWHPANDNRQNRLAHLADRHRLSAEIREAA